MNFDNSDDEATDMTEFDKAVGDIFQRYKRGEINKEQAALLLRPHFGPNDRFVISALLSALTRQNVIEIQKKSPHEKS